MQSLDRASIAKNLCEFSHTYCGDDYFASASVIDSFSEGIVELCVDDNGVADSWEWTDNRTVTDQVHNSKYLDCYRYLIQSYTDAEFDPVGLCTAYQHMCEALNEVTLAKMIAYARTQRWIVDIIRWQDVGIDDEEHDVLYRGQIIAMSDHSLTLKWLDWETFLFRDDTTEIEFDDICKFAITHEFMLVRKYLDSIGVK